MLLRRVEQPEVQQSRPGLRHTQQQRRKEQRKGEMNAFAAAHGTRRQQQQNHPRPEGVVEELDVAGDLLLFEGTFPGLGGHLGKHGADVFPRGDRLDVDPARLRRQGGDGLVEGGNDDAAVVFNEAPLAAFDGGALSGADAENEDLDPLGTGQGDLLVEVSSVPAVGQDEQVLLLVLGEHAPRRAQQLHEIGPLFGDEGGAELAYQEIDGAVVEAQRRHQVGGPGEGDDPKTLLGREGQQIENLLLAPLQPRRVDVLGAHGVGDVKGDHDVRALGLHLHLPLLHNRLGEGDDEAEEHQKEEKVSRLQAHPFGTHREAFVDLLRKKLGDSFPLGQQEVKEQQQRRDHQVEKLGMQKGHAHPRLLRR